MSTSWARTWGHRFSRTCNCACNFPFTGSECGLCAKGYGPWPDCQRKLPCSLNDCGPGALQASGFVLDGCRCTCREGFRIGIFRGKCDACADGVGAFPSCNKCQPGRGPSYPNCQFHACTGESDCRGRAHKVEGYREAACRCHCNNGFQASQHCMSHGELLSYCGHSKDVERGLVVDWQAWLWRVSCHCRRGVEHSIIFGKCSVCSNGYGPEFPDCRPPCTKLQDCNGNAYSVDGYQGNCRCNCYPKFAGPDCAIEKSCLAQRSHQSLQGC